MRRILLAGALSCTIASYSWAQDWRELYQRGYGAAPEASLDFGAPEEQPPHVIMAPTILPISIIDGRAGVQVDFGGGRVSATMIIDTGASIMSVSESLAFKLAARHDATFAPDIKIAMADGRAEMKARIVIHLFSLGGLVFRETEAIVNPDGIQMLLPFDVLAKAGRFTIDVGAKLLIFGGG